MRPSPPPPDNDRLLDRLAAAGPVLDELYRDIAEPLPGPAVRDGLGHDHHGARRSHRGRHHRHRAVAALVVLLLVGIAAGIVVLGPGDDHEHVVKTNTPTTVVTEAELAELVQTRVLGTEACGPMPRREQVPVTWPADWAMVGGYDECITGYVHDTSGAKPLVPVYPTPEETTPEAYWGPDMGWITIEEYRDPTFDVERYRAAYVAARAQIADAAGGH